MQPKLFFDTQKQKSRISAIIKKYGYGPEHNFYHYQALQEHDTKNIFVEFSKGMSILAQKDGRERWWTLDEVLAPEEKRLEVFLDFAEFAFKKDKAWKIVTETTPEFRRKLIKNLKNKYKIPKVRYSLYWPVFSLKQWNPKLEGKNWKKIRNLRNRLYKSHTIKIVDSRKVKKEKLIQLVMDWKKKRAYRDRVFLDRYLNMINAGFKSCNYCRTILVDGKPASISAGWKIPNSNDIYSSVGILNYSYDGIGEVAYVDELNFLKRNGYNEANFGGSDDAMLRFKRKFKPSRIYRTDVFAIINKGYKRKNKFSK